MTRYSRRTVAIALAVALLCGAGIATQARINGELSKQIDDGVLAALISFGSGLVIVGVVLVFAPSGRRGLVRVKDALHNRTIPWWLVIGGVGGATLVLSQGLVAGILGVALFSVAVVAGQTLSGLLVDRSGLRDMAPKPITITRVIGAVLALIAVTFAASTQLHGDFAIWMLALPFISGIVIGLQQAVNGQVREVAESAITATFINFAVGTSVLLIAALVHIAFIGLPRSLPENPVLYLGGLVGVIFIAGAVIVVRYLGVLLLALGTIAGQLLASLVLDVVAPVAAHPLAITTVIGTALTLVAVCIAAIPSRATAAP